MPIPKPSVSREQVINMIHKAKNGDRNAYYSLRSYCFPAFNGTLSKAAEKFPDFPKDKHILLRIHMEVSFAKLVKKLSLTDPEDVIHLSNYIQDNLTPDLIEFMIQIQNMVNVEGSHPSISDKGEVILLLFPFDFAPQSEAGQRMKIFKSNVAIAFEYLNEINFSFESAITMCMPSPYFATSALLSLYKNKLELIFNWIDEPATSDILSEHIEFWQRHLLDVIREKVDMAHESQELDGEVRENKVEKMIFSTDLFTASCPENQDVIHSDSVNMQQLRTQTAKLFNPFAMLNHCVREVMSGIAGQQIDQDYLNQAAPYMENIFNDWSSAAFRKELVQQGRLWVFLMEQAIVEMQTFESNSVSL